MSSIRAPYAKWCSREQSERVRHIGIDMVIVLGGWLVRTVENETRVDSESVKLKEAVVEDLYGCILFLLSGLDLTLQYEIFNSYAKMAILILKIFSSERVERCPLILIDYFLKIGGAELIIEGEPFSKIIPWNVHCESGGIENKGGDLRVEMMWVEFTAGSNFSLRGISI